MSNETTPSVPAGEYPPCADDIFERGTSVGLFDIKKHDAEAICQGIAAATGARVDWHYIAGRVHIKAMPAAAPQGDGGGETERLRAAIRGLLDALPSATTHPAISAARAALKENGNG